MSTHPIRVVELFAGAGGFRIALEGYPRSKDSCYKVVWSNNYEPRTSVQHANRVYSNRWQDGKHNGDDIETIVRDAMHTIPEHDLLVGGFPCQDFSIANRSHNKGLEGTKGKLWFSIEVILESKRPPYVFLENVDRLLSSPALKKGRDFAIILSGFARLGYVVEWKVVNAADYGFPQRRRRLFILAYHHNTKLSNSLQSANKEAWILDEGVLARTFTGIPKVNWKRDQLPKEIDTFINTLSKDKKPFLKTGCFVNGAYISTDYLPIYDGKKQTLGDVLEPLSVIGDEFIIQPSDLLKWKSVKDAKVKKGISKKSGKPYVFKEGRVRFPDPLDSPSRTIITREGGRYIAREKHAVCQKGIHRRLTPIELERLNGFPDGFTECNGVSNTQRAFLMGNALVVGVVRTIANELAKRIEKNNNE